MRHTALVPLSHDHHHGLVAAQRLKRGEPARRGAELADSVQALWEEELRPHFEKEERWLFPLCGADELRPLVERAVEEHIQLKRLVERTIADNYTDAARELGKLLDSHIRFEERELFPEIQRLVPGKDLEEAGRRISGGGVGRRNR